MFLSNNFLLIVSSMLKCPLFISFIFLRPATIVVLIFLFCCLVISLYFKYIPYIVSDRKPYFLHDTPVKKMRIMGFSVRHYIKQMNISASYFYAAFYKYSRAYSSYFRQKRKSNQPFGNFQN